MFSMITNVYNKKTKGPTVMELFTATGKLKKFFWQLEMFDVCTTGDTAHIDMIFKSTCWCVCGNNLNIVSMCAMSPVVHTSNISSCQKNFFSFPVAVNNSVKVGPLGFLVINVCNHREHYEKPCIYIYVLLHEPEIHTDTSLMTLSHGLINLNFPCFVRYTSDWKNNVANCKKILVKSNSSVW
jgi:hypothetical protein